jgi:error-prone DNA polymerase
MSAASSPAVPPYAELAAATNFSFLRGASHPEEMVARAAALGLSGIGIADRNSLAGVVRAHVALRETEAKASGLKLAVGARLVFSDGTPDILAYPEDRAAYGRLSRLLTLGKRRAPKGGCILSLGDLLDHAEGMLLALMPGDRQADELRPTLAGLREARPGSVWLALRRDYGRHDRRRLEGLSALAAAEDLPALAVNDALYHAPERRSLQDVLTAIREHVAVADAGRLLEANAERHLKPPAEMARLFRHAPQAVGETARFLARARFSLDELRYEYPDEPVPKGVSPQAHLEALAFAGAGERYPAGVPEKVRRALTHELGIIAALQYAPYFLTVHDIAREARRLNILAQGRGSAANSAVCFCLGVTAVDPAESDLLFERFLSPERKEPPDIDIDFEHERREEIIQYIYARYGRERAGLCATVISYRPRSAIREVGKALGLSADVTAALANTVWGSWGRDIGEEQMRQAGFYPGNPLIRRAIGLAMELQGFPRHLSQHVGGFILTRGRLDETVPIGNAAMDERTFIEWDKDDIDALGILKVDVLALGMLTCIRKALDLMAEHKGVRLSLDTIPKEDPATYAMIQQADTLGVFQIESRAQMNMLPRLKPACFYDLVIEVAIVRPGPIQGDMVHPYLRRRQGKEKVVFPSPAPEHGPPDELERVLGRTLGVPLFQEQAMRIAIEAAKFTPGEANLLRRAMATFRRVGTIHTFQRKMVEGMVKRGYAADFAERCFRQIEGFGEYGFPESHAASFAKLVYASCWLKKHHPEVFACALLNSQPMGFYAPAQIVRDAREHGVEVRAADVNASLWDNRLEQAEGLPTLRLGFRQIDGFREEWAGRIAAARAAGPFPDVAEMARRAALPTSAMKLLAEADAFRSLGLDRRAALWRVSRLPDDDALPLFAFRRTEELPEERGGILPDMRLSEHVVTDYQLTGLSLKAHPMRFLRAAFAAAGALTCRALSEQPDGRRAVAAGVILVRQKPGSAKGVVFMTIEDETGVANVVVWPDLVGRFRKEVMGARLIEVHGRVQRSPEGVLHLTASRLVDRSSLLSSLARVPDEALGEKPMPIPLARADEVRRPVNDHREHARRHGHPRDVRILPKSRDFH